MRFYRSKLRLCPNRSACASGAYNTDEAKAAAAAQTQALKEGSLRNISHVVMVLSQLAHTLAHQGYAVGLLDVDLCGPSAPPRVPVLGVIENMAEYQSPLESLKFSKGGEDCTEAILAELHAKCPQALECIVTSPLFGASQTTDTPSAQMAAIYQIPFWGSLPMDPRLLKACDQGQAFCETHPEEKAAKQFESFAKSLVERLPVDMATSS